MTQDVTQNIGIDISKMHLDAYMSPLGQSRCFTNDKNGFRALLKWLDCHEIARITYEATGAYHRAFERYFLGRGLPLAKVNPLQARRFAEATGTRAKTDRIDAAMLARFGTLLEPREQEPVSAQFYDLVELVAARRALVKDRTAARNRGKNLTLSLLKRQSRQRLEQIARQITAIDLECRGIINADAGLKAKFNILISSPGIGELLATSLLADMPELGKLDEKQVASLAGLAPITRQSGQWQGKSFICGGRARLRQSLFMPTLVAVRYNPDLKAKYEALLDRGKPKKLAITAIMRKLLILANALIRDNRIWTKIYA